MSFKPDISQIFNAAFGFIPAVYAIPHIDTETYPVQFKIETKPVEEIKKLSWLGTPIMFPMTFKGGVYNRYAENGDIIQSRLNDFELPASTIVDFRRSKHLTKTNLLGMNGSVKEIYGFDDWEIRIRGLCLDTPSSSAYEQQKELLKWEVLADGIDVLGELFTDKDIFSICIENIDFKQLQGKPNIIPFEITALGADPIILSN